MIVAPLLLWPRPYAHREVGSLLDLLDGLQLRQQRREVVHDVMMPVADQLGGAIDPIRMAAICDIDVIA